MSLARSSSSSPTSPTSRRWLALFACALFAQVLGCAPQLDPVYRVLDTRVLAVIADPPMALPGETVTLTPVVAHPSGTPRGEVEFWRCAKSEGDALSDATRCAVLANRQRLLHAPVGEAVVEDIVPADFFAEAEAAGASDNDDEVLSTEAALPLVLGFARVTGLSVSDDDKRVDAIKRVDVFSRVPLADIDTRLKAFDVVRDGDVVVRTHNPLLIGVTIDARDAADVEVELKSGQKTVFEPQYDPRTLESYNVVEIKDLSLDDALQLQDTELDTLVDHLHVATRCEVPVFSWFVTHGTIRRETTVDDDVVRRVFTPRGVTCPKLVGEARTAEVVYTAPDGSEGQALPKDGVVYGWVVMRDGRGGTAAHAFSFRVKA